MEDEQALSTSVKFFDGKFNLLNDNKLLVVEIGAPEVGGVGVNTIVYDNKVIDATISKGDLVSTFRAVLQQRVSESLLLRLSSSSAGGSHGWSGVT
jgi:hypothetical protein